MFAGPFRINRIEVVFGGIAGVRKIGMAWARGCENADGAVAPGTVSVRRRSGRAGMSRGYFVFVPTGFFALVGVCRRDQYREYTDSE